MQLRTKVHFIAETEKKKKKKVGLKEQEERKRQREKGAQKNPLRTIVFRKFCFKSYNKGYGKR